MSDLDTLGEWLQPAPSSERAACPPGARNCCHADHGDASESHTALSADMSHEQPGMLAECAACGADNLTGAGHSVITNSAGLATYDCFRT